MEKLIKDGKVAVVYSPGFGAGWSTEHPEHREVLSMDREIAEAVVDRNTDKAAQLATLKCGDVYTYGSGQLKVEWIAKGTVFRINSYDGSESIEIIGPTSHMVA